MAAEGSVSELAKELGIDVNRLLVYLKDANLPKRPNDAISNKEKVELTRSLRNESSNFQGESESQSKKSVLTLGARKKLSIGGNKDSTVKNTKSGSIEVKRVKSRASAVVKKTLVSTDIFDNLKAEIQKKEDEFVRQEQQKAEILKKEQEEKEKLLSQKKEAEKLEKDQKLKVSDSQEPETVHKVGVGDDSKLDDESKKPAVKTKKSTKKAVKTSSENIDVNKIKDLSIIKEEDDEEQQKLVKRQEEERRARFLANNQHGFKKPVGMKKIDVVVPENITVAELAKKLAVKSSQVIRALMKMGTMATANQTIDQDTAILLVEELGHTAKASNVSDHENDIINSILVNQSDEKNRAPVVTIMGHVDHGKTSLLDYIRKAKVVSGEAGGITQHIGAYQVKNKQGVITFLDTPGHAAFSAMRARGANCTDIVILVVAADDGVMPQTVEAIQHAKASKVSIIVAVNKVDKPEADPGKVKTEVSQHDVLPEDWGGEVPFIEVSAKTGAGVDNLLERIALQAEMLELKAKSKGPAEGVVIESRLDKGRGAVATILVQAGELKKGDIVLVGTQFGKVRAMLDATGQMLTSAGPSTPIEILGLSGVPQAGDELIVMPSEKEARELSDNRINLTRKKEQQTSKEDKLALFMGQMAEGNVQELNVIIKADVQGSVEALSESLTKLSTSEIKVKVLGKGVGGINESDVTLAMTADAIIIGFNVRADKVAKSLSEREKVIINYYSVIYNAIDDVKNMMIGMLSPEFQEKILGLAEVKDVFRSSKLGAIAGCIVTEGTIKRSNPIRVLRDNVVIYEGELESLRRFKDDVAEVKSGTECGIGVKNYNDVKVGDLIEVFERVEVKRTL